MCNCTSEVWSFGPSRNDESDRRPLRLRAPQMLIQPRHDLHKIAGPRPVIELGGENAVPAVAAGARRSRQAEDIGGAGDAGGGGAPDPPGAAPALTPHVKTHPKTHHPPFSPHPLPP